MRQPSRVIAVGLVLVDLPMAWPHRCSRGLELRGFEPLTFEVPALARVDGAVVSKASWCRGRVWESGPRSALPPLTFSRQ